MYLFSDNHILLGDKPSGLCTQDGFDEMAKNWIKEHYNKPGSVFLEPIHRLDKPVSGLVLFARTSKALSRLQEQMRDRQIRKTYIALVEGNPPAKQAFLEHFLTHESYHARLADPSDPKAKRAYLHYHVIERKENLSLVEIELFTGRYHQIRAQFSLIGCPVLGDRKYGSKLSFSGTGIALHHSRLIFTHPVTKEEKEFHSPVPLSWNS